MQYTRHGQMLKVFLFEGNQVRNVRSSQTHSTLVLSSDRRFRCGARSDQFWRMTTDLSTSIEGELAAFTSDEIQLNQNGLQLLVGKHHLANYRASMASPHRPYLSLQWCNLVLEFLYRSLSLRTKGTSPISRRYSNLILDKNTSSKARYNGSLQLYWCS